MSIWGFDCFSGYGNIDFQKAADAGYRFVWVKCVEGNEGRDPKYVKYVADAQAADLAVGPYHFAYPLPDDGVHAGRDPKEQAKRFFDGCKGLGSQPGELSPALDLEWPPPEEWTKWGCTAQQISDWARECCEEMTLLWGRQPIIYTYPYWWRTLAAKADVSWASEYPLWYADYSWPQAGHPPFGWVPPKLDWVSSTWTDWAACQHSANGSKASVPGVPAVPVDRNIIRDERAFRVLRGYPEPAAGCPDLALHEQDFQRFDEALAVNLATLRHERKFED